MILQLSLAPMLLPLPWNFYSPWLAQQIAQTVHEFYSLKPGFNFHLNSSGTSSCKKAASFVPCLVPSYVGFCLISVSCCFFPHCLRWKYSDLMPHGGYSVPSQSVNSYCFSLPLMSNLIISEDVNFIIQFTLNIISRNYSEEDIGWLLYLVTWNLFQFLKT